MDPSSTTFKVILSHQLAEKYLRDELRRFCNDMGVSTCGTKKDLARKIAEKYPAKACALLDIKMPQPLATKPPTKRRRPTAYKPAKIEEANHTTGHINWSHFIAGCILALFIKYGYSCSAISPFYDHKSSIQNPSDTWISGYQKENGTSVEGHWRTRPDGTRLNNYSGPHGDYFRRLNGRD